jgi:hypothetical protein
MTTSTTADTTGYAEDFAGLSAQVAYARVADAAPTRRRKIRGITPCSPLKGLTQKKSRNDPMQSRAKTAAENSEE